MFDFDYFVGLGLNLYTSSHVKNSFNSNEFNTLKSPNMYWEKYQYTKQNTNDIEFLKQQESSGFGIILGFNNIYSLDVDGYIDENLIYNLLYILDLPLDYEWVIKSGSGIGFHIIFTCHNIGDYKEKTIAYFARKSSREFGKIEFKFGGHSILPSSIHETGNYYSFYNRIPKFSPKIIEFGNLNLIMEHYCSYQAMSSYLGDNQSHLINFIAPIDEDLDFIFKNTLRKDKFLVISGDVKTINNVFSSDKPLYLIQMSLLILDMNYNIIFRRVLNYIDNKNIFSSENEFISIEVANKLITGSKENILKYIDSYIKLINNVVVFDERDMSTIQSEIEEITSKRHSNLRYVVEGQYYESHREKK